MIKQWIVAAALLATSSSLFSQVWLEETVIDTNIVATHLEIPWDMEVWANDSIIFTQRGGSICRLSLVSGAIDTLYLPQLGSDVFAAEGQAGMLGLQMHPDFPATPYVYVALTYYPDLTTDIKMMVQRLAYNATSDSLEFDSIIVANIPSASTNLGGRMLITSDYHLLLSVGDVKETTRPQDLNSLNGKILRYNLDGTIPTDNPFSGSPVYTYGNRNPQGLIEDNDGFLWATEHGPSSDDELNPIIAGRNYGWPLITGFCTSSTQNVCDSLNLVEPFEAWSPTIAPAGAIYFNEPSIPEWESSILIACLKEQRIMVAHFDDDKSHFTHTDWVFQYQFGRLRDILLMPNGNIYVCTSNRDVLGEPIAEDDRIIELIPSKHNGVNETDQEVFSAFVGQQEIQFSRPVSGTAQFCQADGRLVATKTINNHASMPIPAALSTGVYFINVNSADASKTFKLFIP